MGLGSTKGAWWGGESQLAAIRTRNNVGSPRAPASTPAMAVPPQAPLSVPPTAQGEHE